MTRHPNGSSAQPSRWRLPQHHEELLRSALRLNGTGRAVTLEQRAVIHQICSSPEKLTFAPEDFVIAFKLALTNAANEVGIRPGPERNDLLSRLVSICIEEFFRVPSAGDAQRSGKAARASSSKDITPEIADR
ncbi:MAG: hypothetical protein QOD47_1142 [Gemmatimonadaceae bacterium]|jgi:hypothetical protein|nr:hypothetical protein [Gemmatimonadaceae bacterium]